MVRAGVLMHAKRGAYLLVRDALVSNRLIVAGTLDRLEMEYGAALTEELVRRGWRHERQ